MARLMSHHYASVARQSGKARLTLDTLKGNVTVQRVYEAIGPARLADTVRHYGTTLRSYGQTLLRAGPVGGWPT